MSHDLTKIIDDMKAAIVEQGGSPAELRIGREAWNKLVSGVCGGNLVLKKGGGRLQFMGLRVVVYDQ